MGPELASGSVAIALAVLAAGGAAVATVTTHVRRARRHILAATALAITPGAIMLAATAPLAGSTTSRVVLALATIAIGVAVRDFDAINGSRGAPWFLYVVTAGGVYLAVPDTELARVMLGVALPFVLLSIPKPLCPFGPAGSAALAGLFSWVVVVGGRGRPGSVVGGLVAIGFLAAEPLGRHLVAPYLPRLGRRGGSRHRSSTHDRNQDSWLTAAVLAAIAQTVLALYASRVVGREDAALSAFVIAIPVIVIAIVVAPELYPARARAVADDPTGRPRAVSARTPGAEPAGRRPTARRRGRSR